MVKSPKWLLRIKWLKRIIDARNYDRVQEHYERQMKREYMRDLEHE